MAELDLASELISNVSSWRSDVVNQKAGAKMLVSIASFLIACSPELAREVMREKDPIFANRDVTAAVLAKALDNIYPLRRREVRQAVREVFSKINTPVDLSEITFQILLNLMISVMWGATLDGEGRHTLAKEFRQWTQDALVLQTNFNVSDLFPVLARFDIQGVVREMNKLSIWLDKVFDSIVDQWRKMDGAEGEDEKKKEGKDFMHLLLQLTEEERKMTFTITNMKAMMVELLVGGTDTTSTMVAWSMGEFLKYPHIIRKVQDELEQVVGKNNVVEESHLPDLHYLDAVLKETHRLHPAIPFLVPRSPSETCVVGGYTVPKGSKIFINAWAIQRDPKTVGFFAKENPLKL
ncbi:flavonoid 3'-monooxygenase CYP75B3-like [Tasmannia lanceolata]|uniref:flavonoid 3'-monooxygenase CYP75B3-like n=1 Tax=Tasmannia lanceolata TaxID=3420 RepID=UPI004064C537